MIGIGWLLGLLLLLFGGFGGGLGPAAPEPLPEPGVSAEALPGPSGVGDPVMDRYFAELPVEDCGAVFTDPGLPENDRPWVCLEGRRAAGKTGQVTEMGPLDAELVTRYFIVDGDRLRVYADRMDTEAGTDAWSVVECPAPADLSRGCVSRP